MWVGMCARECLGRGVMWVDIALESAAEPGACQLSHDSVCTHIDTAAEERG